MALILKTPLEIRRVILPFAVVHMRQGGEYLHELIPEYNEAARDIQRSLFDEESNFTKP
jgi:hypothetical protein